MKTLQGRLLIASPSLVDPNFNRTVVLLVHHNDDGALGLVLNRPTNKTLAEIWDQLSENPCEATHPLYWGGPVPGPLMVLHTHDAMGDSQVLGGLHFSVEKEKIEQLVDCDPGSCRFFVGHAGWAAGQLESELQDDSWTTLPAKFAHVFDDEADLWRAVTKEIADSSLLGQLGVRHSPPDPSLN
jgi:putative transcriptional regulator